MIDKQVQLFPEKQDFNHSCSLRDQSSLPDIGIGESEQLSLEGPSQGQTLLAISLFSKEYCRQALSNN